MARYLIPGTTLALIYSLTSAPVGPVPGYYAGPDPRREEPVVEVWFVYPGETQPKATKTVNPMKDALKPGGTLIIHDLAAGAGISDKGLSAPAYPVSVASYKGVS